MKKAQLLLLFIFPAFYIVIAAYFRTLLGDLSLRSIDPDYVYFSNGLGVSLGALDTGNIFHPGGPLQYFTGLIFRLVYLIRSPEIPYLEDIFLHPDEYLSVVSFSAAGLLAVFLFIAGYAVCQITKSIWYAVLIQTTPFLPIIWYDLIGRVTPELFQAFAVLALSVWVIKYYRDEEAENTRSQVFLPAFIAAFGLSAKVTFLPLIIIPLFLIKTMTRKLRFLVFTGLLFLLLALSVLLRLEVFWNWIKNIFLHAGEYGAGETTILDLKAFMSNVLFLVKLEKFYFRTVFLSLLIFTTYVILFRNKAKKRILITYSAVILSVFLQLLIVSKHFAHRNFIPALLLLPLLVYFAFELLREISHYKIFRYLLPFLLAIFLVFFMKNQFHWLPIKSQAMEKNIKAREETRHFASILEEESIKIITSQNYGCPFKEYALMYSTVWSAPHLKPQYAEVLGKLYPYTYQHTTWDDRFQYWGEDFDVLKIRNSGKKVYLYLERNDEELLHRTLNKLKENSKTPFEAKKELRFLNETNGEVIYELHLNAMTGNGSDPE